MLYGINPESPTSLCPNAPVWTTLPAKSNPINLLEQLTHPRDLFSEVAEPVIRWWGSASRKAIPPRISLVSGAISSVDASSPEEVKLRIAQNRHRFQASIWSIAEHGVHTSCGRRVHPHQIFSQMPFETAMARYHQEFEEDCPGEYPMPILTDFYGPLIERHVDTLIMLPNWQSSYGAQWEFAHFMEVTHGKGNVLYMSRQQFEGALERYPLPVEITEGISRLGLVA